MAGAAEGTEKGELAVETGLALACSPAWALKSGIPKGLAALSGGACIAEAGAEAGCSGAAAELMGRLSSELTGNMLRNEKLMEQTGGRDQP